MESLLQLAREFWVITSGIGIGALYGFWKAVYALVEWRHAGVNSNLEADNKRLEQELEQGLAEQKQQHLGQVEALRKQQLKEIKETKSSLNFQINDLQQHLAESQRTVEELKQRVTPETETASEEGLTIEQVTTNVQLRAGLNDADVKVLSAVSRDNVSALISQHHITGRQEMSQEKLRLCTDKLEEKALISNSPGGWYALPKGRKLLDALGLIY